MEEHDNICPRCKSKDTKITNYSDGEIVCSMCGYIYEIEFIDEHTEKRIFSKNYSSKYIPNRDIPRTSAIPSTYYFGDPNDIQFLGHKKKKFHDREKEKLICLDEKEKKIIKRNAELNKVDYELRKICNFFDISKMIYEATKELAIKLYEYGKIHIRSNLRSKLVLGLLINYTLKNKTNQCFSKEEICDYFQCDIEAVKKEINNISPFLENCNTISVSDENIIDNKEDKVNNYLAELHNNISFLIKKTKIKLITSIGDSYEIIACYIQNNIFNIEVIPPICLAGASMIFCIKLYKIQFTVVYKRKDIFDESYCMETPEEEMKLINYIAKKCSSGIKADKLKSVYEKMKKYKNVLENNDKFKDYLNNLLL